MENFTDKVALVTGGSSGIGRATAIMFGKKGAKVVVANRRVKEGEETVTTIKDAGGEATFIQTDVRIASQVESLVDKIVEKYGRLDIAFNNAGVGGAWARLARETEEAFDAMVDTNLKGVWLCMKYEIPVMQKQGGGVIVNNSSISGIATAERLAVYSATKFGVVGLTNAAAHEYGKDKIRIVAICPGWIKTPIIEPIMQKEDTAKIVFNTIPLGRLGAPEEVAELVTWLASDSASFITGGTIAISGGMNI